MPVDLKPVRHPRPVGFPPGRECWLKRLGRAACAAGSLLAVGCQPETAVDPDASHDAAFELPGDGATSDRGMPRPRRPGTPARPTPPRTPGTFPMRL